MTFNNRRRKIYESKLGKPVEGDPCYYCGLQATEVDHVIPHSMLQKMELSTIDFDKEILRTRTLKVFSCPECNKLLGNSYQESLTDRKKYLKQKLRNKYSKLLNMPDWSPEELNELSNDLRNDVLRCLEWRTVVKQRISGG